MTEREEILNQFVQRYYTPDEVLQHNTLDDLWISYLGKVYDITELVKNRPGVETEPLLKFAGKDISHWFNPETQDFLTRIDPKTNLETYYHPQGAVLHVPPAFPSSNWDTAQYSSWWTSARYFVGYLSQRIQKINIKNVLTEQVDTLDVPSEETIAEIRERYQKYNKHGKSYTWKAISKRHDSNSLSLNILDMNQTLVQNGVRDESSDKAELQIQDDEYIPVIMIYWNDDLTQA